MKQVISIDNCPPIKSLFREGPSIFGCSRNAIVQVDTRLRWIEERVVSNHRIQIKHLSNAYESGVYVCDKNTLRVLDSPNTLVPFNQNSDLTGQFASTWTHFFCGKFHHRHNKYSIICQNLLEDGPSGSHNNQSQKVIKLLDEMPTTFVTSSNSFGSSSSSSRLYYHVSALYKSYFLELEKQSTVDCGIGLFSADHEFYYLVNNRTVTAHSLSNNVFQFEMNCPQKPLKITTHSNHIITASQNSLELSDKRHPSKQIDTYELRGFRDFLFDANIRTLYISHGSILTVLTL